MKIFLRNNSFPVLTFIVNIWCALEVDIIYTNISNTKNLRTKLINANYGITLVMHGIYGDTLCKVLTTDLN